MFHTIILFILLAFVMPLMPDAIKAIKRWVVKKLIAKCRASDYFYREEGLQAKIACKFITDDFALFLLVEAEDAFIDFWDYQEKRQPQWKDDHYLKYLHLSHFSKHNKALSYLVSTAMLPDDAEHFLKQLQRPENLPLLKIMQARIFHDSLQEKVSASPVKKMKRKI